MPMTPEQQEIARRFIMSKCASLSCSACGHKSFNLSTLVVICPALGAGQLPPDAMSFGTGTPMVELICANCGCIRHFSAVAVGLYPKEMHS